MFKLSANVKKISSYHFAVFLSSLNTFCGIAREFLVVGLLGFSVSNDKLQIYLSILYSIALSGDAIRLAVLNLCERASFAFVLFCTTLIALPFSCAIGFLMNYLSGGLNLNLLLIAILGGLLNFLVTVVITYKQRFGAFLSAQFINLLPNLVLIPGIALFYYFAKDKVIFAIVCFCCLIPTLQLLLLSFVRTEHYVPAHNKKITVTAGILVFMKHGIATVGEQIFQLVIRAAFFKLGAGYLSMLAMSIRIYAAARVVLIDSYIGSKLSSWDKESSLTKGFIQFPFNSMELSGLLLFMASLAIYFLNQTSLYYFAAQLMTLFLVGFYFNTLVRIYYFKINRFEHDASLILHYGFYEILFAVLGYILLSCFNLKVIILLWLWYLLKPLAQLLLLRPKMHRLLSSN